MNTWDKISQKIVLENEFFSVREDKVIKPNGEGGTYFVVEKQESVFVVPVNNDNEIFLIKQFRYPTQTWSWELPAGAIDAGETPLEAAERELQEETGLKAANIEKLGSLPTGPGLSNNIGHAFVATGLTYIGNDKQEEEGITDCKSFTIEKIKDMVKNGEMIDVPSLAFLNFVLIHQE